MILNAIFNWSFFDLIIRLQLRGLKVDLRRSANCKNRFYGTPGNLAAIHLDLAFITQTLERPPTNMSALQSADHPVSGSMYRKALFQQYIIFNIDKNKIAYDVYFCTLTYQSE